MPQDQPSESNVNRRRFLQGSAAAGLGASAIGHAQDSEADTQKIVARGLLSQENELDGTTEWQLTRVRVNEGNYRTSLIEGYCSHQSIAAGNTLRIYVSTKPVCQFEISIYRMGYYGGAGARLMRKIGPLEGKIQPTPEIGKRRIRECQWEASTEFKIPSDWPSGVYLGKLTTLPHGDEPYWQSYVIFVVKDERRADITFQVSDNTWQAYNRWPANESLYTHPDGAQKPGVAVSFDRPYGKYCQIFDHPLSIGSGEFLLWEYPLCYWLEQEGLDVTYVCNSDLVDPSQATRSKCFISVGHDEYWDERQYHSIKQAIDAGTNVLWLSGNSVFMVSPFEASSRGQANRIIERTGSYGPLRQDEVDTYGKIMGPFETHGPDERDIIGARSIVPFNGGGDWTCVKPEHWLFAGTGMKKGDSIPGLVGWEFHGEPDLDRAGLEVLAEGTAWSGGTRPAHWTATVFPGPKGNFVFNASTIFWSQGLASPPGNIVPWSHYSRPHGPDERVQRMTRNLLERSNGKV